MEQLKLFCEPIAFICRVRYEIYITDFDNKEEICEKLDENIYIIFDRMKRFFELNNENIELFKKFFFDCLNNIEEWKNAVAIFGKDYLHTKDFLNECFNY